MGPPNGFEGETSWSNMSVACDFDDLHIFTANRTLIAQNMSRDLCALPSPA
jgi:hypothetical protein